MVGCFQPHTYSRSSYLIEGWRTCFESLDVLYMLRTYAARETSDEGMDAEALAAEISSPTPIGLGSIEEAVSRIAADLLPGDVLLTLGAGDVTEVAPGVLRALRGDS